MQTELDYQKNGSLKRGLYYAKKWRFFARNMQIYPSLGFLSLSFDNESDGFLGESFLKRVGSYVEQWDINRIF